MTVNEIMAELEAFGSEAIKKILLKHGVLEPFFGVKVEQLKTIQKKIKKDYQLAKDLYATGNADAMYLAGLIADDAKMTKADLQEWVVMGRSGNINEYTVPWVAAGSRYGFELAMEWIDSSEDYIVAAGWSTLSNLAALIADKDINIDQYRALLNRVVNTIHKAANRVKYRMNSFVISLGCYVLPLADEAIAAAKTIGEVHVDMNGTNCKVPAALDYIDKVKARGAQGKKKKTVKC